MTPLHPLKDYAHDLRDSISRALTKFSELARQDGLQQLIAKLRQSHPLKNNAHDLRDPLSRALTKLSELARQDGLQQLIAIRESNAPAQK